MFGLSEIGCACLYFYKFWNILLLLDTEIFSLEEEEKMSSMFLTQESRRNVNNSPILGDPMNYQSPCVSLVAQSQGAVSVYEDISDDELFKIPCSQQNSQTTSDAKG